MPTLVEPEAVPATLVEDLIAVGQHLEDVGYRFITVTPATHARVLARAGGRTADSLRDIFGWNLPFHDGLLPRALTARMRDGGLLHEQDGLLRSRVRFATVGEQLYAHDAFPTLAADAVFFGPDTYRFVSALRHRLRPCSLLVDVCCGSGAGGLELADLAERVVLADINPKALAFAAANRQLAGRDGVVLHLGDLLFGIEERPDAIVANPPYLADPLRRAYRDGGGARGIELSLRIVEEALQHLAPGGQLLLYTGTPVIDGVDAFAAAALPLVRAAKAEATYEELDPDVFGEELETAGYAGVERIAAVVLDVTLPPTVS